MNVKKILSAAERKKRKAECEKRRRDKIKADPMRLAKEKEKERVRYIDKKKRGVMKPIIDLSIRDQRVKRKMWRTNLKRFREKKKHQQRQEEMLRANTPSSSEMSSCDTSSSSDDEDSDPDVPTTSTDISRSLRSKGSTRSTSNQAAVQPTPVSIRKVVGRKVVLKNRSRMARENADLKRKLDVSNRLVERFRKRNRRLTAAPHFNPDGTATPRSKVKSIVGSHKVLIPQSVTGEI